MTKVVFVYVSILVALGLGQVRYVRAQYELSGSASGLQGLINGLLNAASDTTTNAFETSNLCLATMRNLLQNAHQTFSHNVFTENIIGFHDTGLHASLRVMSRSFLDSVPPLLDTIQAREERIDDLKNELRRVSTQMSGIFREIRTFGARCLTPILANEVINQIYRCVLLPVKNIVGEMRLLQDEIRSAYDQLNWIITRRRGCMSKRAMEAVPCAQTLINEIPMLIETISRGFSIPVSVHQYMVPINECLFTMRESNKAMCPSM
ncbi:unnamed protein product [Hermetia illucens]|uniref:Uncharacterized protein n=1 Tax=Hermetia illucens TaxID=343691 RepID=A0A7R8URB0_HERIL|nr:uncharacterized protein LOC119651242 [Hermetia illucens]CAD7085566.1 unnamed protein product [Hermetia illucens]